jgi:hypothetical protein
MNSVRRTMIVRRPFATDAWAKNCGKQTPRAGRCRGSGQTALDCNESAWRWPGTTGFWPAIAGRAAERIPSAVREDREARGCGAAPAEAYESRSQAGARSGGKSWVEAETWTEIPGN